MARGLHMIQRSAAGTLDLEFGVVTQAGQQFLALAASKVFQHVHEASVCLAQ
ncbi:hypothetical protein SAMN05444064_10338 [Pseudomonas syringae]|nr:hypothetical protein SAMN05444514_10338 [Pseudomonas syringae]SFL64408.1 hypothetical protein SAMN05444064_10338 [Pseudomonas syringae]